MVRNKRGDNKGNDRKAHNTLTERFITSPVISLALPKSLISNYIAI